ncbi:peptidoglycan DD-metalloendopeptidase family protein [Citricoccus nitrophenolicus]|uniref:Peptidoglycan DD-metalloendopeptidase family protein n=1 Tax=Citricoccus nitrophenolicus TaxID=863575 RepID=A0ABV0IE84_9MICC
MHNPCLGLITSEHEDDGGYKHHRGRDIGTRILGPAGPAWVYGIGKPVYAAFSGRWKKIVRWSKPGNRKSTWAPTRTGNGGLVANPDGEGNGYNHVRILDKWDEGDWINEGELIGHLDLSGNMTAPHLHFEMWLRWQDPYSDYSPKIVFDKYGVSTLDDPATANRTDGATITPAETAPERTWFDMATLADLQKAFLDAQITVQRSGKPYTITVKQALQNSDSSANAIYGTGLQNAGKIAALENAVEQIASGTGVTIDYAKVQEAAKAGTQEAIAAGIEVEGTVQLTQKEA